uniref:KH domain-containing, RNA-binding, signal transduction-associated protein 2 n=1 Tax=Zosterops lateralis melanops TaxID=1220523 RepID=A0A8D2NUV1_ZOSLA
HLPSLSAGELVVECDLWTVSFASALLRDQSSEGKKEDEEKKYLDVISNKNIKLSERVLIPVKQYPKFNFVGKLLGPRGNSLKRLQEETGAKMSILGKGSMRDKAKEEELRKSGEAKYAHLSDELHVLIEVFAPPGEAYSRMSHALEEIKKFLVPDYNDEIRQEQLRELSYLNGSEDSSRGRGIRGRGIRVPPAAPSRCGNLNYYGYDDGYGGEYDDPSYEAYDNSYATQTQSVPEYYDYGHGTSEEAYDSYAQEEWATTRSSLKAPPPRSARGGYREHPYGRY